jgi:ubiquinone/menaquinone biosynthesis C-methylase UbiE
MISTEKDFSDPVFAERYTKRHNGLLHRLGNHYANELIKLDFRNERILDTGCGSGEMLITMARKLSNCKCVGIDISEPLLKHADELNKKYDLNHRVNFIRGDVTQLPFETHSFDAVFNISMVHFIDEPLVMLNEINRVLKPNGRVFIKDLRYSILRYLEDEIKNSFSIKEAKELVRRSDLSPGIFTHSLLWWNYVIY